MNTLERLKRLLPVPENPVWAGSPDRWQFVESMAGTELPLDYKQYINKYGGAYIGDFLYVRTPFTNNRFANFLFQLNEFQSLVTNEFESMLPYPFFPKPNGLLPFGDTSNGGTLFWVTKGIPSDWTILSLNIRGHEYTENNGRMVDLLADLLEDRIKEPSFSSEQINFSNLFVQYP
jgi:hypothetical protein